MNAKYLAMFAAGATIGSAVSWYFTKKKCNKEKEEEIESVKKSFGTRQHNETMVEPVEEPETEETKEVKNYNSIVEQYKPLDPNDAEDAAYTISPEEFGEIEDYKVVSLTYFEDGTLADDSGSIYDVDETIGIDALASFGEYEDDAVHVRNDYKKTDYEVLLDARTYGEVFQVYRD